MRREGEDECRRCQEKFHSLFRRLWDEALACGTLARSAEGTGSPNFTMGREYLVDGKPMVYRGVWGGDEIEVYREVMHVFEAPDRSSYRVLPESGLDSVGYL
jgi:hypothetical protein